MPSTTKTPPIPPRAAWPPPTVTLAEAVVTGILLVLIALAAAGAFAGALEIWPPFTSGAE